MTNDSYAITFSTFSFLENFSEYGSAVLGKPVNVWNHLEYGQKAVVKILQPFTK